MYGTVAGSKASGPIEACGVGEAALGVGGTYGACGATLGTKVVVCGTGINRGPQGMSINGGMGVSVHTSLTSSGPAGA